MAGQAVALCSIEDIPDGGAKGLSAEWAGRPLALIAVRRGQQVWLYRNCCPHFSIPLDYHPGEFCTYKEQLIMCAHHSALFRFEDGVCVDGPCTGARLEPVACHVQEGRLVLGAAQGE
ncbi:Rieske (2Fe-2S) protein [Pseudomonas putida]